MKPEIRKPTEAENKEAGAWTIWEKEVSEFEWEYDSREICLILEGQADVTNESNEKFSFGKGDYIIFPKGMKCTWKVNKKIKKHYNFD